MNLDLNLGPLHNSSDGGEPGSGSYPNVAMNLEDWLDGPVHRIREVVRHRGQTLRSLWGLPIPPETRNLALELIDGNALQNGEGSDDAGKNNDEEGSYFDCNICLDLAKDPVVTCCGHLFCWPCLYRWLHHHSDAKECPVCKGEVTIKNVTPIYGRGNNMREPNVDCSLKIPLRPKPGGLRAGGKLFRGLHSLFQWRK
ncbi:hypothetical protein Pfo_029626 [Paulownia fortunei]|nr:hypothetical protein Pfo_029626 [Paulownia fortunei]